MAELWQSFGDSLLNILPRSPFRDFIASFETFPGLSWLNWLIPVGTLLEIFGAWLGAVAVFYLAQIVLRWLKVIQG